MVPDSRSIRATLFSRRSCGRNRLETLLVQGEIMASSISCLTWGKVGVASSVAIARRTRWGFGEASAPEMAVWSCWRERAQARSKDVRATGTRRQSDHYGGRVGRICSCHGALLAERLDAEKMLPSGCLLPVRSNRTVGCVLCAGTVVISESDDADMVMLEVRTELQALRELQLIEHAATRW